VSKAEGLIQCIRRIIEDDVRIIYEYNTQYTGTLVSKDEAEDALKRTKEVFTWLLTLKPSEN
jgi:HEPN domain-containing protein